MHQVEPFPQSMQQPPEPAAEGAEPRHDQVAAVYRDGVLVQEPRPAQNGLEVERMRTRLAANWKPDKLARPIVLAPCEDNLDAATEGFDLTREAKGHSPVLLGEGKGVPSRN